MLTINEKPPAFVSRAVGILEGRLTLDPSRTEKAVTLTTADGAVIPGGVHGKAMNAIIENPLLLTVDVRVLVYPRTVKSRLEIIVVDIEEKGQHSSELKDQFLIQGMNIGSKVDFLSKISIRSNRGSKHKFEKFWLNLFGKLNQDQRCVYSVRALRKGRKLFIIKSEPILPKNKCSTRKIPDPKGTVSTS